MKKTNKKQYLAIGFVMLAAACGVKPGHVDAPAGVSPDPFPQVYPPPAAKTDPADLPERYLPDTYQPQKTTTP